MPQARTGTRHTLTQTTTNRDTNQPPTTHGQEDGPIDRPKTVADVRPEPYALPGAFEWADVDVSSADEVREVYELLSLNYVEDDDAMFR